MKETKIYIILIIVLTGIVLFSSVKSEEGLVGGAFFASENNFPISENRTEPIPELQSGRADIVLSAKAAVVKETSYDVRLLDQGSDKVLPMASLTKLMTALVVWQAVSPDDVVEIMPEDINVVPNKINLVPGEKIKVKDLVKGLLIASGNDAARALARYSHGSIDDFVTVMNHDAKLLGMSSTSFANPIGFDSENHHTTIRDMEILVEEFLSYPDLVSVTGIDDESISSVDGKYSHHLKNTNELLTKYSNVVGLKTGYTEEARENLVLLVREGEVEYYTIILGSEDREADGTKILKWVDDWVTWK